MSVESQPRRRSVGFKRVRDVKDLRPYVNHSPSGRRVDHEGNYLSPLRALTTQITATYNLCNPQFRYESAHNPRRVLTKPSKPAHNDGYDNEDYDYILYVNDWLGSEEGQKYLILDVLGQGTFGQVVKCQNSKTNEILAVKVIKNKPAYFNQSMMEVTILQMLNNDFDPHDEHHILRLRDSFIHKSHLCLVFEQLSSNLYELIKQNQFQGLSTQLVKVFTAQLLDALVVLKDARLIHCDLKPENILLKSLQSPQIKVIDFGSACHERQTVYTYIQSRFYRSPEVLLGIPYTAAIDMWSLGCIAVELFLGLPLFPGTSEYNQLTRIVELLGLPPQHMLDLGKQASQFLDCYVDNYGHKKYRLKSLEQYSRERNTQEQVGKQYFSHKTLADIIRNAPLASSRHSSSVRHGQELEREANNRAAFIDFCQGLLNLNPLERWTPLQAKQHPFITGEKFSRPFNPIAQQVPAAPSVTSSASASDPKRPYGGLLPSQPKGGRAYQDAASYNQQLAQHQAYTAQAQAASQATATAMRNPYVTPATQAYNDATADYTAQQQQQQPHAIPTSHLTQASSGTRGLTHQASAGSLGLQYGSQGSSGLPVPATNPNPPSGTFYPATRARANTINQMDVVPPALARLSQMGSDVSGIGRNALTPVMQRDDAMREWERRQSGKGHPPPQAYPQLEYLQQQAELATASGLNWAQASSSGNRYAPSNLSYQPSALGDQDRNVTMRDAVMSSVRSAARQDPSNSLAQAGVISTPPQAYAGNSTTAGNRYTAAYQQTPTSYDAQGFDGRNESSSIYMPVQPQQFQPYGNAAPSPSHGTQQRHNVAPSTASVNPSFYGSGVVPTGQTYSGQGSPNPAQGLSKDARRISGMDVWQR
ncbi:kinase-like domain-containing protein [Gautieria morchelliformis]|nr:kinase-like domain-containing protein [Gautieria morchelliformis]